MFHLNAHLHHSQKLSALHSSVALSPTDLVWLVLELPTFKEKLGW